MSDSNLTGKTQGELDKSGHTVAYDGKTIIDKWGKDSGHIMGDNGTAQPKPQGQY